MANEQLKLELKEHYSKSFTKLESALQAQALKADEDRQRLASVQAEVVKVSKSRRDSHLTIISGPKCSINSAN